MVHVDQTLTKKVAALARLELTSAEVELYTAQIEKTLSYIDQLSEVDVSGVEPMIHPHSQELLKREDKARTPMRTVDDQPAVLEHAPEVLYGGFKVPPIL